MIMLSRNLDHLRLFLAARKANSLTRASDFAAVTRTAAAKVIRKLERECGGHLHDRDTQGFFLTARGIVLAGGLTNAFEILDPALADISPRLKFGVRMAQLRALVAVRETGNYALAANRLELSQATVRQAVAKLEKTAGRKLFESTRFGMIASPGTDVLVQAVKLAMLELDQVEVELAELDGGQAGRMVIGTESLFRSVLLPKTLTGFWKIRPGFPVQVIDGSYGELLNGLLRGDIHILLGELRYPEPDDELVQERLIYDRLAILAGRHHPLAGKPGVTSEELLSFGWVAPPPGTPARERFESLFGEGQLPACIVETDSILLMRDILVDSELLGCISNVRAKVELSRGAGAVCEIDADTARTGWPVGLSHRRRWSPTLSQEYLLDQLREESFGEYEEETRRNLLAKA